MCTVSSATSEEESSSTAWTCHRGINTRAEALRRVVFKRKATSITEHKHSLHFAEWLCDSGWVPSKYFQVSSPEEGMLLPLRNDGIELKKYNQMPDFLRLKNEGSGVFTWSLWISSTNILQPECEPCLWTQAPGTPKPLGGPTNGFLIEEAASSFFFLEAPVFVSTVEFEEYLLWSYYDSKKQGTVTPRVLSVILSINSRVPEVVYGFPTSLEGLQRILCTDLRSPEVPRNDSITQLRWDTKNRVLNSTKKGRGEYRRALFCLCWPQQPPMKSSSYLTAQR